MLKTYDILLDIEKELYSASDLLFSVSRNDFESVELNFKIKQDDSDFDLTGSTMELAIKKPSGLTVYQTCEITNAILGEASVLLSIQGYVEYGVHVAEIYIRNTTQLMVTSSFWYSARTAIMESEAIDSINEWSALQQALFAYDLKPLLTDGFPTATPEYIGQMAFDVINKNIYIANDLTSVSWQSLAAGEGGAGGNDTILGIGSPTIAPARIGQLYINTTDHEAFISTGATSGDWEQIDAAGLTSVSWADVANKPATFPPDFHSHTIGDVTNLSTTLDAKAAIDHDHDWTEITGKPTAFIPLAHVHDWIDITGKPTTFTPAAHTHLWAQITDKPATFAPAAHSHAWTEITAKPTTFTPTAHAHTIADVTGLQTALDGKADDADLAAKADTIAVYAKTETYTKTEVDAITSGITEGGGTIVQDNLTSVSTTAALSANQGRVLNETKAAIAHNHLWADITDKPTTFTPAAHVHAVADVTGLQTALDGKADDADLAAKADIDHTHLWADITDKPTTFTPAAHVHAVADVTGLQTALDGKADDADLAAKANTIDVYAKTDTYTKTEVDAIASGITEGGGTIVQDNLTSVSTTAALSANQGRVLNETKADTVHTHAVADVTGLQTALDGKADDADLAAKADTVHTHAVADVTGLQTTLDGKADDIHTHLWADITDKPTTFTPAAHVHAVVDVTGLQTALDGKADDADLATKADTVHTHAVADVTGLQTALDGKADDIHTHLWADITDKPTTFTPAAHSHDWTEITAKPTTFTPTAHVHAVADVTGLQAALDGKADDADLAAKANTVHTHAIADVTGLQAALDGKADDADLLTKANTADVYTKTETYTKTEVDTIAGGAGASEPLQVTAAPITTPEFIGQTAIDTVNKRTYVAEGATSADWRRLAGTNYVDTADGIITNTILAGLQLWTGTQTAYDAIGTKSATTLYFISGV